jgi:hypothetical protein
MMEKLCYLSLCWVEVMQRETWSCFCLLFLLSSENMLIFSQIKKYVCSDDVERKWSISKCSVL